RGRVVSFDRALETVERLSAQKDRGVEVSVNHTIISRQSLQDHDELCRLLEKRGVDVHWVLAYEDSAMYGLSRRGKRADDLVVGNGYPLHPALDRGECLSFVEDEIARVGQLRDPVIRIGKRYYLRGLRDRLERAPHPEPRPKCVAL